MSGGLPPAFVLEVASESTAGRDLGVKRDIYARMGALEYWRMDPSGGDYYGEALVGERLVEGEYERFELRVEENGDVWSRSEVLGLDFYWRVGVDGYGEFLVRDAETGEWLVGLGEEREARVVAEEEREAAVDARIAERDARLAAEDARLAERDARLAAEARARELEAELERLRETES